MDQKTKEMEDKFNNDFMGLLKTHIALCEDAIDKGCDIDWFSKTKMELLQKLFKLQLKKETPSNY